MMYTVTAKINGAVLISFTDKNATRLLLLRVGLPDAHYFTGALVFQPTSPVSRNEVTP